MFSKGYLPIYWNRRIISKLCGDLKETLIFNFRENKLNSIGNFLNLIIWWNDGSYLSNFIIFCVDDMPIEDLTWRGNVVSHLSWICSNFIITNGPHLLEGKPFINFFQIFWKFLTFQAGCLKYPCRYLNMRNY